MSKEVTLAERALLAASDVLSGQADETRRANAVLLVRSALAEFGWCSVSELDREELADLLAASGLNASAVPKQ